MKTGIIVFNIIFYFVTLFTLMLAKQDPSASLGYGIFILIFWAVSLVALIIFIITKLIVAESVWDRIGVLTATPFPFILALMILKALH